jgi:hypothetical protein
MSDQDIINTIRAVRDIALDALEDAIVNLDKEIEQTPLDNIPYLKQLNNRRQSLVDERNSIMDAASAVILSLPSIAAAAKQLNDIAMEMKATAQEMPNATNKLMKATAVLSLGQQFTDLIASKHKA